MYRRRVVKSRKMTKNDFIYQAASFFLSQDKLDIYTQLEILLQSKAAYDINGIEYAQVYSKLHKMDLLTEIGHLSVLLEKAYEEGIKAKKHERIILQKSVNNVVEED